MDAAGERRRFARLGLETALALFVSLLALFVSAYSTYWQRQQVRAQVWPRLELSFANSEGFELKMANVGTGPALVRAAEVLVDGQPLRSWTEVIQRLAPGKAEFHFVSSYIDTRVLAAGERIAALSVPGERGAALFAASQAGRSGPAPRLEVRVCFCSVLDECWRATFGETESVRACAKPRVPFGDE
jgi:hypothetical protein